MFFQLKYAESEWDFQKKVIEEYPLGTVITATESGIIANHIPFVVVEKDGKKFLHAHIAKANHQLAELKENDRMLVVFSSDNSYIAPAYYATKKEDQKVVPTWDFAAVHCHGRSRIIDDPVFVRRQLDALAHQHELKREKEWTVDEAPERYVNALQKAIAGLEIEIERIEGKFKFEQSQPQRNIDGVAEGLAKDGKQKVSEFVRVTNARRAQKSL